MPTVGPHAGKCCVPPPPDKYACSGVESTIEGLPVYLSGSHKAASAILFICDIYGWKVPQTRRLADRLALAGGYYVIMPDFMENDFFFSSNPDDPYEGLEMYLARRSQCKAIREAGLVIDKLRKDGFQCIGVAGFCWGGKILASLVNDASMIDAAVMLHPSFLLMKEMRDVKVPLAILGAEIDDITPPEMAMEFGAVLAQLPEIGDKTMVRIFKGADHGFSTRYDPNDAEAVARAEEAYKEMLQWFRKYLCAEAPQP